MSLEVICDYKESLPTALSTETPLTKEVQALKKTNIDNGKKMTVLEAELKTLQKTSAEILKITQSLNKEILSLINEPPELEDDSN